MPYDPTYPPTNAEIESAPLRGQFNGLKDLIDAIQTITAAQVDATNTLPAGEPAAVTLNVVGGTLQFTFHIPTGPPGSSGSDGSPGQQGPQGEQGAPGAPGEVTLSLLDNAIAGVLNVSSNLSNMVDTINQPADSSYNQTQMQDVLSKLDELILALRR